MAQNINLDPISGFPEFLPAEQLLFNRMLDIVRRGFERHGFTPIETPAIERKEVLTSKGGDEREIYALSRLMAGEGEDAETDYAMHFDLTVPLARYVSQHQSKLTFPFRRYQIQKVWRGERAQAGRYREFYQCDIDIIGRGKFDILNDAEIPSVIYKVFDEMQIGAFVIRMSNRKILQGYFTQLGITADQLPEVMRTVDKLEKIGREKVLSELTHTIGLDDNTAQEAVTFLDKKLSVDDTLAYLQNMGDLNETFANGVSELTAVVEGVRAFGVPDAAFAIDLSVVRGLDYYTGTIYETTLIDHPEIGSICSGGRYDNLTGHFTNEALPGVGISIGLSRLIPQLIEAGVLKADIQTIAPVLVTSLDRDRMSDYLRIASDLRNADIPTEVYLDKGKFNKQMKFANNRGFRLVIIAGGNEFEAQSVKIKDMASGEEHTVPFDQIVEQVKALLST